MHTFWSMKTIFHQSPPVNTLLKFCLQILKIHCAHVISNNIQLTETVRTYTIDHVHSEYALRSHHPSLTSCHFSPRPMYTARAECLSDDDQPSSSSPSPPLKQYRSDSLIFLILYVDVCIVLS